MVGRIISRGFSDDNASIGIGSLIIFISLILVAGITASVIMQTMNSLQQRALTTGQESIRDIADGVKVTHVAGYSNGSKITQLALFISPIAGSNGIDLTYTSVTISDTATEVILSYNSSCFSGNASGGLFGTVNSSNLTTTTYGVIVIRDIDNSCSSSTPLINNDDLVVILVNTTKCFNGISTRTKISGKVIPEHGVNGVIAFTTPSAYVDNIIDLQP